MKTPVSVSNFDCAQEMFCSCPLLQLQHNFQLFRCWIFLSSCIVNKSCLNVLVLFWLWKLRGCTIVVITHFTVLQRGGCFPRGSCVAYFNNVVLRGIWWCGHCVGVTPPRAASCSSRSSSPMRLYYGTPCEERPEGLKSENVLSVYSLSADNTRWTNQDAHKWEVIHMWRLDTPYMLEKSMPQANGY